MQAGWLERTTQVFDQSQQSWRLLGLYVDCQTAQNACTRYMLWAAYVDNNDNDNNEHSGNKIGYQVYNHTFDTWDNRLCQKQNNQDDDNDDDKYDCPKLDCHNMDSHRWKLLGIFKQQYYASEFFEQLFKHQGYCLWDTSLYNFMQNHYNAWPQACVQTSYSDTLTDARLYLDLRPGQTLQWGLYIDPYCQYETLHAPVPPNTVAQQLGYVSQLTTFNAALDFFRQSCQPCVAYSFQQQQQQQDNDNDSYSCYDDADYSNVNQCMKFRTQTNMDTVSVRDLQLADYQHALPPIKVYGVTYGNLNLDTTTTTNNNNNSLQWSSMASMVLSLLLFLAVVQWKRTRRASRALRQQNLQQPLVSLSSSTTVGSVVLPSGSSSSSRVVVPTQVSI